MTKPLDPQTLGDLGRATTLEGVRDLLIVRRKQLGLPQRALDDLAGYADGYTAKLEAGMKWLGKLSIPCLLGALKCELVLMPAARRHREKSEDFGPAADARCARSAARSLARRAGPGSARPGSGVKLPVSHRPDSCTSSRRGRLRRRGRTGKQCEPVTAAFAGGTS